MSSFWEKRRAAVAAEEQAEAEADARAETLREEADLDALPDAELLAKYDLPEPEALDSPDAVREFLSHGLPQRLKTRALRRLWRLNPVLANVDGLVDYGEDYTDSATVIENMQTVYQVGKGMLARFEELAEEADEAAPDTADAAPDDGAVVALVENDEDEPAAATEDPEAVTPEPIPAQSNAYQDDAPAPFGARRRMTFQFEHHK